MFVYPPIPIPTYLPTYKGIARKWKHSPNTEK